MASDSRLDRVHERIAQRIAGGQLAGAVSLVYRQGRILHSEVQGWADIEAGKRLEKDAIFRLASMTKPIIGVAIMALIEQGRLKLDDPLGKYIPEFTSMNVAVTDSEAAAAVYQADPNAPAGSKSDGLPPYKLHPANRGITIRDLLTHSCGLGQGEIGFHEMKMPQTGDTLAGHIPQWASVPLDFQPGSLTGYSAIAAFDLLGRVVELVSGLPLDQSLKQGIFQPLGMTDTTFVPTEEQWARVVTQYESTEHGLIKSAEQRVFYHPTYFSGAAGLFGTLEDYSRFALMLANGGELDGARILSRESVRLMGSAQLASTLEGFPPGQTWGLSMRVITDREAAGSPLADGSFGWSGAWGTHFWIDPQENMAALLLLNLSNAGGADAVTAREFETAVMASIG